MRTGLVLDLLMGEGSGGYVYDLSGNVNTGTITGATWVDDDRRGGKCLSFDGDDSVNCGNAASLQLVAPCSMELWVKSTDVTNSKGVMLKALSQTDVGGFELFFGSNGALSLTIFNTTWATRYQLTDPLVCSNNVWYHFIVTITATLATLYKNGVSVVSGAPTVPLNAASGDLLLGNSVVGVRLGGLIDKARIYNRALTAAEVMKEYLAGIETVCQIAFTTNLLVASPTWVDVSSDMQNISTKRGRQYEMNRIETGEATIQLLNTSGNYWMNWATSPYYPNVRPVILVKLGVIWKDTFYPLFYGYVESWKPEFLEKPIQVPVMTLTCVDMTKCLTRFLITSGGYSQETSGVRIDNILNSYLWQAALRNPIPFVGQYNMKATGALTNANALEHIHTVEDTENGYFFIAPNGKATFQDSSYRALQSSSATFGNVLTAIDVGNAAINRVGGFYPTFTVIDLANPANATGAITSVQIWAEINITGMRVGTFYLVSGTTYKCRDSVTIGNVTAGSLQTFGGLSLAVQAGDYIGCYWGAGQIKLDTTGGSGCYYCSGEYIDPGDQDATYIYLSGYAISLYGFNTVNNKFTDIDLIDDDKYQFNEARVTNDGGVAQTYYDSLTQTRDGKRILQKTGLLYTSDDYAYLRAYSLVQQYKNPFLRARSITITGNSDPANLYPKIFSYDISTRITINLTTAYLLRDYFIEGIALDWDSQTEIWNAQWQLSDIYWSLYSQFKTETLRPNAAGDLTEISQQNPDSGYHWEKVDEATPDDADFVQEAYTEVTHTDLYNLPPTTFTMSPLLRVTIHVRVRGSAGYPSSYFKIAIKTNGTVYVGGLTYPTTSFADYSWPWYTNLVTGLPWTVADINALQIGILMQIVTQTYAQCSQVYVEVVGYL